MRQQRARARLQEFFRAVAAGQNASSNIDCVGSEIGLKKYSVRVDNGGRTDGAYAPPDHEREWGKGRKLLEEHGQANEKKKETNGGRVERAWRCAK